MLKSYATSRSPDYLAHSQRPALEENIGQSQPFDLPPGYRQHYGMAEIGPIMRKCSGGACKSDGGRRTKKHLQLPPGYRQLYGLDEADQVMRKCSCGGTCAACRKSDEADRQVAHEDLPASVTEVLSSPGRPLPPQTQDFMESRIGHDFSQVRIHTDARAAESADAVAAQAYTHGQHIVFGDAQYSPSSEAGQRLLAHELTHVAQQASGIRASSRLSEPGDPEELEADRVADRVVGGLAGPAMPPAVRPNGFLSRSETPITLDRQERERLTAGSHPAAVSALGPGRPLTPSERGPFSGWSQTLGGVRVHDDLPAQVLTGLLGDAGFAVGHDVVLGQGGPTSGRDSVLAHELTHVMQQNAGPGRAASVDPEAEADHIADLAVRGDASVAHAQPGAAVRGLAEMVIGRVNYDLPNDLLLIVDVDDGDFVGGCVKAIVPHLGVKLIKKGVPKSAGNQLFNLHLGVTTNLAGESCFFFYESVSGVCDMNCFATLDELKQRLGELRDWLKEKIQQVLEILLPTVIAGIVAYVIADILITIIAAGGVVLAAA